MTSRAALLLLCLPLVVPLIATAEPIQLKESCTATLGLPTCFPHDGLVDWSVWPGIGDVAWAIPGPYPASGIDGLTYTITGKGSVFVTGSCPGSIPNQVSYPPACGGLDSWANWAWGNSVDGGFVTVTFNRPVEGAGLMVAGNGNVILHAYDSAGRVLGDVGRLDSLGRPAYSFIGITDPRGAITSVTVQGFGQGWTGDIQLQSSSAPGAVTTTPEPVTLLAVGLGLTWMAGTRRR